MLRIMKIFLSATACSFVLHLLLLSAQPAQSKATVENNLYRVEVNAQNGVISRILDKTSGIELISEPRLADNFRMLIPLPDLEGNYIVGKGQIVSELERKPDSLLLRWTSPLTNARGKFDVRVAMKIALEKQA